MPGGTVRGFRVLLDTIEHACLVSGEWTKMGAFLGDFGPFLGHFSSFRSIFTVILRFFFGDVLGS